jgi:hypothetical protein
MNLTVKEILKTLSALQQRAKEKDPINAKKKERFVMGLKQVSTRSSLLFPSSLPPFLPPLLSL